ncbi:hypothetical protein CJU60_14630 [Bacillus sp. 7705b]|nr:hypothetical protein CJU60_14630 [Bacillus sp. 7705b]
MFKMFTLKRVIGGKCITTQLFSGLIILKTVPNLCPEFIKNDENRCKQNKQMLWLKAFVTHDRFLLG